MSTDNSETDERPIFKILSVDGGGFKGLSTAAALSVIEENNGSILNSFDLLCGTSTGGLIVLALAAGKSAKEIKDFYQEHGPDIFPPLGKWDTVKHWFRVGTSVHKHKYSNAALQSAIEGVLEGKLMSDAEAFLCIPAIDMRTFKPRVFKTDHAQELVRDNQKKMSEVALATSAAPTIFPIISSEESNAPQYFADGGLWANNPALVGLTEALRFFAGSGKEYQGVNLLSIGCADAISGRSRPSTYARWGHSFAIEMAEAGGVAQQKATQFFIQHLKDSFSVPILTTRIDINGLSAEQKRVVSLDKATEEAIGILTQLGIETGHDWKTRSEIRAFFEVPAPKIGLRPSVI